jgi:hypothetical protein
MRQRVVGPSISLKRSLTSSLVQSLPSVPPYHNTERGIGTVPIVSICFIVGRLVPFSFGCYLFSFSFGWIPVQFCRKQTAFFLGFSFIFSFHFRLL